MLSMTGGRRQKEVDGCDEDVGFDSFCEATQNMLCHMQVAEGEKPSDPDTLDYVFEHVESIVCIEGADGDPNQINLDNSFLEDNIEPEPEIPRIIETFYASSFDTSTEGGLSTEPSEVSEIPAPFVQKGAAYETDMLDYVFEKVESLVCQEDAPGDHYLGKYGTTSSTDMARDNSLIAVSSSVRKKQTRTLDILERKRISEDDTVVVEVIYEEKTPTEKKKPKKKSWLKKLAYGAGKS